MNSIEELRTYLGALFTSPCNMKLFLGFGESSQRVYRLADLDDSASDRVCAEYVAGIESWLNDQEVGIRPLSLLDERARTLYRYDLEDKPEEFAEIARVADGGEVNTFLFDEHPLEEIRSLLISIRSVDKHAVFVKQFFPVSLVRRDQTMLVVNDKKRFTTVDQDILRITRGFEVLLVEGEFYVNDIAKLDRVFGFSAVADRQRTEVVRKILALDYVADVKGHLATARVAQRHILRARSSRVFELPAEDIIAFIRSKMDKLSLRIVDDKIQLSSAASVGRFLKVLNDDYLTSELTHIDYDTVAKDELVVQTD